MCGIFGFVSQSAASGREGEIADIVRHCRQLIDDIDDKGFAETSTPLAALTDLTLRLVTPRACIDLSADSALRTELDAGAAQLRGWIGRVERHLESDHDLVAGEVERLNGWLTSGRDAHWRLQRDILDGLDQVAALTAVSSFDDASSDDAAAPAARVAATGWLINTACNAIDRLEVRGRDSAGISVLLSFGSAADVDRALSTFDADQRARLEIPNLGHRAIARPDDEAGRTLVFVYKVAEEVGKMGDNIRALRGAVHDDRLFWVLVAHSGVETQLLAHTRWASNGIISIANCHPIDGAVLDADDRPRQVGRLLAVLNGDIDNYRELRARHGFEESIDSAVTTDAKIIPLIIEKHLAECGDLGTAFRLAIDEFEGSMAIAVVASGRPNEILLAQKGSGQGLYVGPSRAGVAVASELYGLVELTPNYLKLDGERRDDGRLVGEAVRIRREADEVVIERLDRTPLEDETRFGVADITTRDIDRGEHEHYLAKEIGESVDSVRKTLRGRFDLIDGRVTFRLADAIPSAIVDELKSGRTRRILAIGQGTAAVAAAGVAHQLEATLRGLDLIIGAMHATELSGHHLRADMSDTLLIAVSQSGTTTDTNRTVDMARKRGARVVAIVNRRSSDLVFRADGVLYTSDGRDVEMSVASTKAFYAQNVAGRLLALYLASELGTYDEDASASALEDLRQLPELMQRVLQQGEVVAAAAARFAPTRRHWAIVGSGVGRVAADEIRIKLSELCYKSIASDYIEDKKHIDLSSEPLVIVCATGLPAGNVSDVVKEVAIFHAHRSIPIVITEEGEDRFDPYAAQVLRVPSCRDGMAYLLATIVGHLFGYHAARHFDALADDLRRVRTHLVRRLEAELIARANGQLRLEEAATRDLVALSERLTSNAFDSCLEVGTAVRLSVVCDLLLGRLGLSELRTRFHRQATVAHLIELGVEVLTQAVRELQRPIDAIKHQAKTVTVGISRAEMKPIPGPMWEPLRAADLDLERLDEQVISFLNAFQPLVEEVAGVTRYRLSSLDPVGRPTDETTIQVLEKSGVARTLSSRADHECRLTGTKWVAVKEHTIYMGKGQVDGRRIMLFPVEPSDGECELYLYHVSLRATGDRAQRMAALRGLPRRHDRLIASVTERNLAWTPELVDAIDNETLFFAHVDVAAAEIADLATHRTGSGANA